MKLHKSAIQICFFLLLFISNSFSQNAKDSLSFRHLIKIYPLSVISGEYLLGYEKNFNKRYSFEINVGIFRKEPIENNSTEEGGYWNMVPGWEKANGFSARAGIKRYSRKYKAPFGFYKHLQLMYKYVHFDNTEFSWSGQGSYSEWVTLSRHSATIKYLIGKQMQILKTFSFEFYFGFGLRYKFQSKAISYGHYTSNANGYYPGQEYTQYYDDYRTDEYWLIPTIHTGFTMGLFF